jgi:hypothetical protein
LVETQKPFCESEMAPLLEPNDVTPVVSAKSLDTDIRR